MDKYFLVPRPCGQSLSLDHYNQIYNIIPNWNYSDLNIPSTKARIQQENINMKHHLKHHVMTTYDSKTAKERDLGVASY